MLRKIVIFAAVKQLLVILGALALGLGVAGIWWETREEGESSLWVLTGV